MRAEYPKIKVKVVPTEDGDYQVVRTRGSTFYGVDAVYGIRFWSRRPSKWAAKQKRRSPGRDTIRR